MPTPTLNPGTTAAAAADSDSEDDYMKMTFDAPPAGGPKESSLARLARLRKEASIRGRPKSKAELEAEAQSRLEAAHSQSLLSQNPKSKGLAMMAKMGFAPGKALGKDSGTAGAASTATATAGAGAGAGAAGAAGAGAGAGPALEPIRVSIKDGREGIGLESERKRKLREAAEQLGEQNKKAKVDEGSYRDRIRKEKEEARLERELRGAQKVAERFGAEKLGGAEGKVLKAMPVVWRGLVKVREEGERSRKMRHDLEVGLASARLPTYDDGEEDEDDRKALGKDKKRTTYEVVDDLDEEDEELDEFEKLPVEDRLSKVVEYLREEFNYCFWCKFQYPDKELEGCPGLTEQNHD